MGHVCVSVTFDLYRLNEGHTVFLERKITGRLHKSQALLEFMAAGRAKELKETIVNIHAINNRSDTCTGPFRLFFPKCVLYKMK